MGHPASFGASRKRHFSADSGWLLLCPACIGVSGAVFGVLRDLAILEGAELAGPCQLWRSHGTVGSWDWLAPPSGGLVTAVHCWTGLIQPVSLRTCYHGHENLEGCLALVQVYWFFSSFTDVIRQKVLDLFWGFEASKWTWRPSWLCCWCCWAAAVMSYSWSCWSSRWLCQRLDLEVIIFCPGPWDWKLGHICTVPHNCPGGVLDHYKVYIPW